MRIKQIQFETFQREFEIAIGPKVEERIKYEKQLWEQDQGFLLRREITKANEEKTKEIAKLSEELNNEKEKFQSEREKTSKLEKVNTNNLLK